VNYTELTDQVLRKLKVLGAVETASAEDAAVVRQALKDAHSVFSGQDLVQWTLNGIPSNAGLGYVLYAAYLSADEFVVPKDETWAIQGLKHLQSLVHIPAREGCRIADF
jgi:hypothetical protein